jgi:general secretion pathway protein A
MAARKKDRRAARAAGAAAPGGPHLSHWGLAEAPFLLAPDPRFLYERADHREGLARILFGITQLGGLVMITGEIGCGKTLLAQTLHRTLDGDGYRVAEVSNPPRTATALLGALIDALGLERRGATAARLAGQLREELAAEAAAGRHVVLAVDEAQRLDPRALDELRLLTNPDRGPGAPVVLLGQPELAGRVNRLPQVSQRVVVRYHIGPMDAAETASYIAHRARVAGARDPLVTERAAEAVHAETGGVPRLVNLLLANALLVAAGQGERQIGVDVIRDLAEDRRLSAEAASRPGAVAGEGGA